MERGSRRLIPWWLCFPVTRCRETTFPGRRVREVVNLEYTLAAARAFQETVTGEDKSVADLGGGGGKRKFRFVYCSGMMMERDQGRKLWVMEEMRKMRVRCPVLRVLLLPIPVSSLHFHEFWSSKHFE